MYAYSVGEQFLNFEITFWSLSVDSWDMLSFSFR